MNYDHILVRFGELTTKGKNRKLFLTQLYRNIKKQLSQFEKIQLDKRYDRIFIILNGEPHEQVVEAMKRVFGIQSFSLAIKIEPDIKKIQETALYLAKQNKKNTFKIETRRNDKNFPYSSDQINRLVATNILINTQYKVDVHQPEMRIKIEVRADFVYVMDEMIKGAGGYPLGVGGKGLLMLSGGIDSPVAGYMMMKRGINVEGLHFASPPYTSDEAQRKVEDIALQLCAYSHRMTLLIVPFTKLQEEIYRHVDHSYAIIVMRRMMYRIADKVSKMRKLLVIVNGESIGQVASQTLKNINVVNEVTSMPIIRPLASYDKVDIMAYARQIGTYDISIRPYEDCCTIFTPKSPVIAAKLQQVLYYESLFDWQSLVDECILNTEVKVIEQNTTMQEVF